MKLKVMTAPVFSAALLLAPLLAFPGVAPGQERGMPDSPRGRMAGALVKVIEAGDEETIRKFFGERVAPQFRDAFPMEEHVRVFQQLRRALGEFEPAGLEPLAPNEARLTLRAKGSGETYRVDYAVEAAPPHRLASMKWEKGPTETPLTFNSPAELDEALRKAAAEDRFSGVVLAAKGNKPVFLKSYGLANRDAKTPVREDTLFDIGSINKMFTSVAVLRLAQEGKLGLDDPLGKHLKGFPAEVANKVTLRQLLRHRSGMGDYLTHPKFREDPRRFKTVGDYLEIARSEPLRFEPGTQQSYSNMGYVVLGAVVEAVTGRSYYDVIDDYVYKPAGMKSSGSFDRTSGAKNMAIGYSARARGASAGVGAGAGPAPVTDRYSPKGSPAGGGFSTAEDLWRFMNALLDEKLLDRRHTGILLGRFSESGDQKRGGSIIFGGGADGVNAVVAANLETRDMVIVLANRDEPTAERVGEAVFRRLNSL